MKETALDEQAMVFGFSRLGNVAPGWTMLVGEPLATYEASWQRPLLWLGGIAAAAFGVAAPDVPALLSRAKGVTILAAGEKDPMCPPEHLLDVAPDGLVLPGVSHNVHVESPLTLWPILDRLLASATDALGQ